MNHEEFKKLQKDIIETSICLIELKKNEPQIIERLTWFIKGLTASKKPLNELSKWFSDIDS